MPRGTETQILAKKLKGKKLVIPDLKPIFSHWPSQQSEHYAKTKDAVQRKLSMYVTLCKS
jgi:hypothetical protein